MKNELKQLRYWMIELFWERTQIQDEREFVKSVPLLLLLGAVFRYSFYIPDLCSRNLTFNDCPEGHY
jgi:hypothetical protein